MLTLLKFDPVFRRTHLACLLAALLTGMFLPLMMGLELLDHSETAANKKQLDGSILGILLITITMHSMFINIRHFSLKERLSELERSLPITHRSAYLQKILSAWIALATPLLTACIIVWAFLGFGEGATGLMVAACKVLASITAGIVVLYAWSPRSLHLSTFTAFTLVFIALIVVLIPQFFAIGYGLDLHLAISVVGMLWIGFRISKGMPGDTSQEATARATESGQPLWSRFISPMTWVLLRGSLLRPSLVYLYIMGPVLLLSSAFTGSSFGYWFAGIVVFQGVTTGLVLLNGLDSLPISRTRLLPFIVLPSLLIVAVSFALLSLSYRTFSSIDMFSRSVQVESNFETSFGTDKVHGVHLLVPPHLWEWSLTETNQTVSSPWGESFSPLAHPIFPGSPVSVFNPYDVGDKNTVQFLTWQISRTLSEVYGLDLSQEQVYQRWYTEYEFDALIGDHYDLTTYAPKWTENPPKQIPNRPGSAALLGIFVWFFTAAYVMRKNVPLLSPRAARNRTWIQRGLLSFLFAVLVCLMLLNSLDRAISPAFMTNLHVFLNGLLGSSHVAWIVLDLTVAAVLYMILRSRILKLEVPTLPKNGWTKKELSIF